MNKTIHDAVLQGFAHCVAANLAYPPKKDQAAEWAKNFAYLFEQSDLTDPEIIVARFTAWAANNERFPNAPNIIKFKMSDYKPGIRSEQKQLPAPQWEGPNELGRAHLHYQRTRIAGIGEKADTRKGCKYQRIHGQWMRINTSGHAEPLTPDNARILEIYRDECQDQYEPGAEV